jgi:hypothetical protein
MNDTYEILAEDGSVENTILADLDFVEAVYPGRFRLVERPDIPVLPPPSTVPLSVTMRQARLALLRAGLLAAVDAAVASQDQEAQIEWQYAADVERSNPLFAALAAQLSLTDQQLDDLFIVAATF